MTSRVYYIPPTLFYFWFIGGNYELKHDFLNVENTTLVAEQYFISHMF